jgi:hypothetical protein
MTVIGDFIAHQRLSVPFPLPSVKNGSYSTDSSSNPSSAILSRSDLQASKDNFLIEAIKTS